jgi:hypothetical protein
MWWVFGSFQFSREFYPIVIVTRYLMPIVPFDSRQKMFRCQRWIHLLQSKFHYKLISETFGTRRRFNATQHIEWVFGMTTYSTVFASVHVMSVLWHHWSCLCVRTLSPHVSYYACPTFVPHHGFSFFRKWHSVKSWSGYRMYVGLPCQRVDLEIHFGSRFYSPCFGSLSIVSFTIWQ